jgi:hypothetical protein
MTPGLFRHFPRILGTTRKNAIPASETAFWPSLLAQSTSGMVAIARSARVLYLSGTRLVQSCRCQQKSQQPPEGCGSWAAATSHIAAVGAIAVHTKPRMRSASSLGVGSYPTKSIRRVALVRAGWNRPCGAPKIVVQSICQSRALTSVPWTPWPSRAFHCCPPGRFPLVGISLLRKQVRDGSQPERGEGASQTQCPSPPSLMASVVRSSTAPPFRHED